MSIKSYFYIGLCWLTLTSCESGEDTDPQNNPSAGDNDTTQSQITGSSDGSGDWLIPLSQVLDGGPGKDGIPALNNPRTSTVNGANLSFLNDEDLVLGLKQKGEYRAYPHAILDWHEIINDDFNDMDVAVTYCPLTGTGIGWSRNIDGKVTTFGVSGLLYNSNLIPYDRATDSYWSQQLNKCVHGEHIGTIPDLIPLVETTWATWKKMYPETLVVSSNTGYPRDYTVYPYRDYKTSDHLIFPIEVEDDRLHPKERILGVLLNDEAKVFRFEDFEQPSLITDVFNSRKLIIIGSQPDNFMVAFEHPEQNAGFSLISNQLPLIMQDENGNEYDIFGEVINGPDQGLRLIVPESYIGYWFSFGTFYPAPVIHNQ